MQKLLHASCISCFPFLGFCFLFSCSCRLVAIHNYFFGSAFWVLLCVWVCLAFAFWLWQAVFVGSLKRFFLRRKRGSFDSLLRFFFYPLFFCRARFGLIYCFGAWFGFFPRLKKAGKGSFRLDSSWIGYAQAGGCLSWTQTVALHNGP